MSGSSLTLAEGVAGQSEKLAAKMREMLGASTEHGHYALIGSLRVRGMQDENPERMQDDTHGVFVLRRRRRPSAEELAAAAARFAGANTELMSARERAWKHRHWGPQPAFAKPGELPPPEAMVKAFESTRSLVEFARVFYFDRSTAIKALATAGINIHEEVAREWKSGSNTRELSARHGVTRTTIGCWIKKGGETVRPRNGNREHDEDLIVQIYDKTNSANRAARAANVHWATARRILKKHNRWHGT